MIKTGIFPYRPHFHIPGLLESVDFFVFLNAQFYPRLFLPMEYIDNSKSKKINFERTW